MILSITSPNPKFIADAMLGRLSKKLRLLGYDCTYFSNIEDDRLLSIADAEKRVILTKDVQLTLNAKKKFLPFVCITGDGQIEQLYQINSIVELEKLKIESSSARCSSCNGKLEGIQKSSISDMVPRGVLEINENFWKCADCKKIYWDGTHMKNLQKFVEKVHERLY